MIHGESALIGKAVKDLESWIERWVKDLVDEDNIHRSMGLTRELLRICNHARRFHADAVIKLAHPKGYASIFMETSAYMLYHWEAMVTHLRLSPILALSALYNPAFTLLRSSLEPCREGAFYECLAHKRYRDDWILPDNDDATRLLRELKSRLTPAEEEEVGKHSAMIFDKMREPLYTLHLVHLYCEQHLPYRRERSS